MPVLSAAGHEFPVHIPVIVVGAGACGSVAALTAHEHGAQVVLIERDALPRGNTALSSGQIPAGGTHLQQQAGVHDLPEILERDLLVMSRGECDLAVAHRITAMAASTIDWLVERHGFALSCITDFKYPGNSADHMHTTPHRSGAELMDAFSVALARQGIETVTSAQVVDLYVDDGGKVVGVGYMRPDGSRETAGCDALILASNGFGGSRDLVRKYIPEMASAHHHGHENNDGSAVLWGEALGASLKDMGSFQGHGLLCTPYMIHIGWPSISQGGFVVNARAERFDSETLGVSELALKVLRQPGGVAYAIWDGRCDAIADQMHNHQEARRAGAIRSFPTTEALAAFIGCKVDALRRTSSDVEAFTRGERQCPLGRDFTRFPPLAAPYFATRITGALFHTQGGLEVNTEARVLRKDGTPFPNLFAGGGAARGLMGPADWGYLPGAGLLSAVNLGRIAGEAAARLVRALDARHVDEVFVELLGRQAAARHPMGDVISNERQPT